jgi:peptidoglycan glycosyltransferase
MNRKIRQLAVGLMVCYVVLFVALNYWQVGRKEELDAQFDNTRQVLREFNKPRGPIVTADGIVAAISYPTDPLGDDPYKYRREYPTGDLLSEVTGYFTFAFGSTKVERFYGPVLTGSTAEQQVRGLGDLLEGQIDNAGTVQLALRADAQQVAKFLLGGRAGSIVVLEPATGAVRVMYSNPSYDPNTFVNADFEVAQQVITDLQNADGQPLLSGAYQDRFMPGSTFKVITAGIGLENGTLALDSVFPSEREWVPPQTNDPIQNYNGSACGGDLAEVFARSCNIPFAKTAIAMGPEAFLAGAAAWGIGEEVPLDIGGAAGSSLGNTDNLANELPLLGIRGFGQSESQMTPLHMAMVAGTVANGGQMMAPYVVEAARTTPAERLEEPHLAGHLPDPHPTDDRRGRTRHRQLLHRPRRRHPGGGQDRHRTARHRLAAGPLTRVDRRLRPRRRSAVRHRRDAHQCAVDRRCRRHWRTFRRSDRQGHARLPADR